MLSAMAFNIKTFTTKTLSITIKSMIYSIIIFGITAYSSEAYAECHVVVIMLSAFMLNVVAPKYLTFRTNT